MTEGVMRGNNRAYATKVPCDLTHWMLQIKQEHKCWESPWDFIFKKHSKFSELIVIILLRLLLKF